MIRVLKTFACALRAFVLVAPGAAALQAQGTGFAPGGQQLVLLDFATQALGAPSGIRLLDGGLAVVDYLGQRMLKASTRSTFLVQLPSVLPTDFTLEFDIVPKMCCNPEDLTFEGTPTINQGDASAHVMWHRENLKIVGGGGTYDRPMPSSLAASTPGALTNVEVRVQGQTIQMYTNGRFLYSLDRQFVRSRVLRVFLGGQNDTDQAVYLARMRIAAGAPVNVTAAAPFPAPGQPVAAPPTPAAPPVTAPSPPPPGQPSTPPPSPPPGQPVTPPPAPASLPAVTPHDEIPIGESFGQFLLQPPLPPGIVARGSTLRTIYRSGHPLNDLRRNVRIERDLGGGNWNLVAWDNLPEMVLQWARDAKCPDPNNCYWSTMDVFWTVPQSAAPGTYRIRVSGSWKHGVTGAVIGYQGTSRSFAVQ